MEKDPEFLYIFGDGDRVRERLEGFLLSHDLESLASLSRSLSEGIRLIGDELSLRMGAELVMAGGDDILVRVPTSKYDTKLLDEMVKIYIEKTGLSMSFGVGLTLEQAYLNLRRAKSSNSNKIVETRTYS
jgi:hypothetical protein